MGNEKHNYEFKKIRTIRGLYQYIKAIDPDTAITEYGIRTLVRDGILKCIKRGNRSLVTYEDLCEILYAA